MITKLADDSVNYLACQVLREVSDQIWEDKQYGSRWKFINKVCTLKVVIWNHTSLVKSNIILQVAVCYVLCFSSDWQKWHIFWRKKYEKVSQINLYLYQQVSLYFLLQLSFIFIPTSMGKYLQNDVKLVRLGGKDSTLDRMLLKPKITGKKCQDWWWSTNYKLICHRMKLQNILLQIETL